MNPLRHYPILNSLLRPFRLAPPQPGAAQAASFAGAGQRSVLTDDVQFDAALTRLYRFLRNERFANCRLTEQLLKVLAQPDHTLLLALAWTCWQDRFSVLTAAGCGGTRSVPVAASACGKRNLARAQNLWEETFRRHVVARLRACGVCAVWRCARGFQRGAGHKQLVEMKQGFVVRLPRAVPLHLPDGA